MKTSNYCIVSLRSTLLVQGVCDKKGEKKTKKMYFSKVNIYHDKLYEDKRKTSTNKAVSVRTRRKEKYNYDMEAAR